MKIIGLLGGVAGGKSMVAGQLALLGAKIINADKIGHEVLRRPEVGAAARERWGEKVFGADGRIDRGRLARIVFAPPPHGPPERTFLEQLTHPKIIGIIREELEFLSGSGNKAAVIDAPLLMESGLDGYCDKLMFVEAPAEVRLKRALIRGWKEEDFAAREDAQKSLDFKRSRADVVIDNSGSPDQTLAQVRRFWQTLIR